MNKREEDKIMGDLNEDLVELIIIEKYNQVPRKTEFDHPMDFETDTYYFEVKSRRNKYNTYPTTMIGFNKWQFAKTSDKKVIFIFSFTDGIYKYEFNKKDKFDKELGGRYDRGFAEVKNYIYIPIDKLERLD